MRFMRSNIEGFANFAKTSGRGCLEFQLIAQKSFLQIHVGKRSACSNTVFAFFENVACRPTIARAELSLLSVPQ